MVAQFLFISLCVLLLASGLGRLLGALALLLGLVVRLGSAAIAAALVVWVLLLVLAR